MRVTVVRRGGLAGVALRGDADTADLPAQVEAAVRNLPAGKPAAAPSHPDGFQYEVSFGGQSAVIDESEVNDDLRPLIEDAMSRAAIV